MNTEGCCYQCLSYSWKILFFSVFLSANTITPFVLHANELEGYEDYTEGAVEPYQPDFLDGLLEDNPLFGPSPFGPSSEPELPLDLEDLREIDYQIDWTTVFDKKDLEPYANDYITINYGNLLNMAIAELAEDLEDDPEAPVLTHWCDPEITAINPASSSFEYDLGWKDVGCSQCYNLGSEQYCILHAKATLDPKIDPFGMAGADPDEWIDKGFLEFKGSAEIGVTVTDGRTYSLGLTGTTNFFPDGSTDSSIGVGLQAILP